MTDELSITLSPADLPAISADIDVPESGPASMTVAVIGDARARAHDVMSVSATWNTHTASYPGMTGIGGASVKRGLDGDSTTLKAWELQGQEFRLPELAVYTIAVPDGDKVVKFADLDGIVTAAAAAAGATIAAPLPWAGYRVREGSVKTEGKTLRELVAELWGALGYQVEYSQGQQRVVRRAAAADTIYPAPYDEEQIDVLDDNVPVALVITGGTLKRDPVTGDIIGAPELDTDPDSRSQGRNIDAWKPTIRADSVGSDRAYLRWDLTGVFAVQTWELEVATGGVTVSATRQTGSSASVPGLLPGTTYSARVRAVVRSSSSGGQISRTSLWSEPATFTTKLASDFVSGAAVLDTVATQKPTAKAITVSWKVLPAFDPVGINLSISTAAGVFVRAVDGALPGAGELELAELTPGTAYTIQVRAVSRNGNLSAPLSAAGSTVTQPPGALTNLQVSAKQITAALAWTFAPRSSATRVTLYQGSTVLQDLVVPARTGEASRLTLQNLRPGERYSLRLAGQVAAAAGITYGPELTQEFLTAETDSESSLETAGLNITLTYVHQLGATKTTTTLTRVNGRETRRVVTIEGAFIAKRVVDEVETSVAYSGVLSQTTTSNVYGIVSYPDAVSQVFSETITYGPDIARKSAARIEKGRVTRVEAREYDPKGLYLKKLTQQQTVIGSDGQSRSSIRTELHVPGPGGLWSHEVQITTIRPDALYNAQGIVSGYETLIDVGLPQVESGFDREPDRLTPVQDPDGKTIPALPGPPEVAPAPGPSAPATPPAEGASGFSGGGVADPVDSVPTFRLPLTGGTQAEVTVNFSWVTNPARLEQLALLLAPKYLARQRVKRRYFAPVQASRADPGVTAFSVHLEAGDVPVCEVTVTTEFPL